jgi:hypothetical protein
VQIFCDAAFSRLFGRNGPPHEEIYGKELGLSKERLDQLKDRVYNNLCLSDPQQSRGEQQLLSRFLSGEISQNFDA